MTRCQVYNGIFTPDLLLIKYCLRFAISSGLSLPQIADICDFVRSNV